METTAAQQTFIMLVFVLRTEKNAFYLAFLYTLPFVSLVPKHDQIFMEYLVSRLSFHKLRRNVFLEKHDVKAYALTSFGEESNRWDTKFMQGVFMWRYSGDFMKIEWDVISNKLHELKNFETAGLE